LEQGKQEWAEDLEGTSAFGWTNGKQNCYVRGMQGYTFTDISTSSSAGLFIENHERWILLDQREKSQSVRLQTLKVRSCFTDCVLLRVHSVLSYFGQCGFYLKIVQRNSSLLQLIFPHTQACRTACSLYKTWHLCCSDDRKSRAYRCKAHLLSDIQT